MPVRNFTDSEEEQIAKIYLSGKSAKAIARAYGLSHHISITSALRRQGVTQRPAPERNRLYGLNPNVFNKIDNELAAYWWGFLYADGCVHRRTLLLRLKVADRRQCERLKDFMQSESPIKKIVVGCSNGKKYKQAAIEFTDRNLAGRLRELGIDTGRPYPHRTLRQIPDNLFNHWLRGLFDGDGSARKNKSICFCGDYELLTALKKKIAQKCQTNPNIKTSGHKTADLYYIYYSHRQAWKVIDFMYQDATIWLERKRNVMDNWPKPQLRTRNKKGQFVFRELPL